MEFGDGALAWKTIAHCTKNKLSEEKIIFEQNMHYQGNDINERSELTKHLCLHYRL